MHGLRGTKYISGEEKKRLETQIGSTLKETKFILVCKIMIQCYLVYLPPPPPPFSLPALLKMGALHVAKPNITTLSLIASIFNA